MEEQFQRIFSSRRRDVSRRLMPVVANYFAGAHAGLFGAKYTPSQPDRTRASRGRASQPRARVRDRKRAGPPRSCLKTHTSRRAARCWQFARSRCGRRASGPLKFERLFGFDVASDVASVQRLSLRGWLLSRARVDVCDVRPTPTGVCAEIEAVTRAALSERDRIVLKRLRGVASRRFRFLVQRLADACRGFGPTRVTYTAIFRARAFT